MRHKHGFSQEKIREGLLKGLSNKEISKTCDISENTVKYHLTTIFHEYGCKTRLEYTVRELKESTYREQAELIDSLKMQVTSLNTELIDIKAAYDRLKVEHGRAWLTLTNAKLQLIESLPMGVKRA